MPAARRRRSQSRGHLRVWTAMGVAVLMLGTATSSQAVEPRAPEAKARSTERSAVRHAASDDADRPKPSAMDRLSERLRSIPLRPVKIGTTPRLPTDPEPGVGVVFKIRF